MKIDKKNNLKSPRSPIVERPDRSSLERDVNQVIFDPEGVATQSIKVIDSKQHQASSRPMT